MSSKYTQFLKKWSNVNDVSPFFGSDKPDFLRDWQLAKAGKRFEISRGKFIPISDNAIKTFDRVNKLRQKINKPFPKNMEEVD